MEKQARPVKQHDREGQLCDHERAAKPPPAIRRKAAASGRLKPTSQPIVCRPERWKESREHGCDDRDAGGERQDRCVDSNRIGQIEAPQRLDLCGNDSPRHPERQQKTEAAAAESQQERFGHELADDAASPGPECASYGNLFSTGGRPREQQACDVRAGNQQHEPDGSKEQQKRRPHVADDLLVERPGRETDAGVRLGELLFETAAQRSELGVEPPRGSPRNGGGRARARMRCSSGRPCWPPRSSCGRRAAASRGRARPDSRNPAPSRR